MWWELRTPSPLFDLRLFRDRTFAASATAVMTVDTAMMGTMFMSVIFMIAMMDYSELKAGLAIATLPVAVMILTPPAGWLADRIGPRWLAVAGALVTAAGLIALGHLARTAPVSGVVWRSALVGAGIGLSLPALLAAGMGAVPGGHKGAGSGMLNTARQLGFVLGVAIIVAVFAHTMGQAVNRAADEAQALTRAQDGVSQPVKDRLVKEFDKVRTIDATSGMDEIRRVAHPIAEDIGTDVGFFEGLALLELKGRLENMLWDQVSAAFRWPFYTAAIFALAGAAGGRLPAAAPAALTAVARRPGPAGAPSAYTDRMPRTTPTLGLSKDVIDHLENVASNLQLDRRPLVRRRGARGGQPGGRPGRRSPTPARARPPTRSPSRAPASCSAGTPSPRPTPAVERGQPVMGARRVLPGGGTVTTEAYPIGAPAVTAVVLRTFGEQIETTTSRMENAFIESARDLLQTLRDGPLLDTRTGRPFWALRRAGDGVLRVSRRGIVTYASPNAVSIMRNAGVEGRVTGMHASELPGGGRGIAPLLGASGALAAELEVAGHILSYRSLALPTSVAGARRGPHGGTPARARAGRQGGDHPRGPPPGEEQPPDHRLAAAHAGPAQRRRGGAARARRGDRAHRLHGRRPRPARPLGPRVRRLRRRRPPRRGAGAQRRRRRRPRRRPCTSPGAPARSTPAPATSLALVLTELVHNALEHAFDPGAAGTVHVDVRARPATRSCWSSATTAAGWPRAWTWRTPGASGSRSCARSSRRTCGAR